MFELVQKSGIFGFLIVLCSIFAVTIIVERLITFRKVRLRDPDLLLKIIEALNNNTIEKMLPNLEKSNSPIVKIVYEIISRHIVNQHGCCTQSREAIEKTINYIGQRELRELEKYLPTLSSICQISPLLGLLGTVTGMIKAFMVIQQFGGKVNAQVLAGGIWEAMLTTAMGLIVAIPSLLAYNYFNSRIDKMVSLMNEIGNELIYSLEKAGYFRHKHD